MRRAKMTTKRAMSLLALVAVMSAACANDTETEGSTTGASEDGEICPSSEAPDSLTLGVWAGPQSDLLEVALSDFEDATGIDVEFTGDNTAERVTRIRAEVGNPTIDVAILDIPSGMPLQDEGVVIPLGSDIPNYENLKDSAKEVAESYGVIPTSILQTVIAYNPEFVDEEPTSWLDLLDEKYSGHVGIGIPPQQYAYGTLAGIAYAMGGSEENLIPAVDAVGEVSDQLGTVFDYGPGIEPLVESGDLWIYAELSGLLQTFRQHEGPIELTVPKEGGPAAMNVAVIPAGGENIGCAKALVGDLISDPVQEQYMSDLYYAPAISTVTIPDELQELVYPHDESSVINLDWGVIDENKQEIINRFNQEVTG